MARKGDGLYLRGKVWYLDCRLNGSRHIVKIGRGISRSVAGELAQVKRGAILKQEAGIGRKRKDVLFDQARQHFEQWAEANTKPRTVKTYKECLRRLAESFSGKRLSEIASFAIERHKQARIRVGAKVRPNRELNVLQNLYNKAEAWKLYEGENPVPQVRKLKEPKQRDRILELEEEARLLAAAPEPLRSYIIVCSNTGLRSEAEALSLRWQDVDLRRGLLTVQAAYAKNGTTRTIPLNTRAREALRQLRTTARGDYVFSKPNGQPYRSLHKPFQKACTEAKLAGSGVTPYTLRHTFASRLAMAGVGDRTLQDLGGWKTPAMIQRYTHLSPSHKAQAVERIATEFHDAFHDSGVSAV